MRNTSQRVAIPSIADSFVPMDKDAYLNMMIEALIRLKYTTILQKYRFSHKNIKII